MITSFFRIGPNKIDSENEFFPIPFVGMNKALSDVDYLAAAFYARGGMNTKWVGGTATFDPDGPGPAPVTTFDGTYGGGTAGVDLMQAFLNLTYARKLSDQFSLGASAIFAMQRFEARGYSRTEFVLRMTRAEIGSFLGLKLETVSRVLSRFAQDGLIDVNQKHVRIVNPDGLRQIVSGQGN